MIDGVAFKPFFLPDTVGLGIGNTNVVIQRLQQAHPIGKADDYRDQAMAAQAKLPPDPVGDKFQGGPFCSAEYDADRKS